MMFAWQKLVDARGVKRDACTIRQACKISGYEKRFLLAPDDTTRFISGFLIAGVPFAFFMAIALPTVLRLAIGSQSPFDVFSPRTLFVFMFHLVMFGGIMGVFFKLYGRRSGHHAVRAMTRSGLCPACAYRIDEVAPEPDGCTVCPECGGAWRVHPGTNTEP